MVNFILNTVQDIISTQNVSQAQKDAAVKKLNLSGEFAKAKAIAAHDYGRDGVDFTKPSSVFSLSNLKTSTSRLIVNTAFAPIALPYLLGKNFASAVKGSLSSNKPDGSDPETLARIAQQASSRPDGSVAGGPS